MQLANQTLVTYFIIKGISDIPELQVPIFLMVLLIYLITLGGNLAIFILICLDHHLHTPMYFFLANLSALDMSTITLALHKILITFMSGDNTVSFFNCMTQVFIFLSLTCDELLILTAMSYDRYVAICKPLNYPIVMSHRACALLAISCWSTGFIELIPSISTLSGFTCYRTNEINHFFCDIVPVMKISCSNTSLLQLYILIEGGFLGSVTPFILTFISYIFIIVSIVQIQSSIGRHKAFYTCSSHLTVVNLLYGTLIFQYFRPTSADSLKSNKFFALFNTVAVPLPNPLIYSLKNKDVKSALKRMLPTQ
ncbi:olfactory receptor 8D1-like [Pseudophryne corroboree]|uniref:olfactory receptor 8D1-like n=1 Tax=Pseudophryne corroboree TaxID=495146 RepID=UPI003081E685